jgi:hypothetical protein
MADLSKFGVPLNGANLGILQPKQKYRFRMVLTNFGDNSGLREMTANVVSCTRPKFTFEDIKIDSYNSVAWIQGKHSFETIELTLRDDITNSVVSSVGAQVQKQYNFYEQTSAVAGINYKFQMNIDTLDGTADDALESCQLDGVWITGVQYPEGDYASGDSSTVVLTLRYDDATNVAGPNTNNGTTVGGNPFPNISSPTGGVYFG